MEYYNSIIELIGRTPLIKLQKLTRGIQCSVFAKMESLNPGGSVKDRIGISMIEAAERDGRLLPGGTVVEATSGNTGIGLALASIAKGYKCVFVMTDKVSHEKRNYLKALGASVVICPVEARVDSPDHYINTAKRIAKENANTLFIYQYENPNNPEIHYRTTGPEIWKQTNGKITHFVSGIGTGGTISGTGRYLKEVNPKIKIIGADPLGSVLKHYKEQAEIGEGVPYLVEGIGQETIHPNIQFEYIDEIHNVTDKESFTCSRRMTREEGIFCGGSTGTIVAVALRIAQTLPADAVVVFIVCDTGERYLSKHHNDDWLKENQLYEAHSLTLKELHESRNAKFPAIVSMLPSDSLRDAAMKMNQFNISQMPVLENGKSVGSVREASVLAKLLHDPDLFNHPIQDVMEEAFPVLQGGESVDAGLQALKNFPAILLEDYGRIIGILTRYDILQIEERI